MRAGLIWLRNIGQLAADNSALGIQLRNSRLDAGKDATVLGPFERHKKKEKGHSFPAGPV
jgi:hypothetical protein